MQYKHFEAEMMRIGRVYSQASLSDERKKVLWEKFKLVPEEVFTKALNYLIGEFTTQALPSISKISEAIGFFQGGNAVVSMRQYESPFQCEPCRDLGFGFVGDLVVACSTCERGRYLSPAELARQQGFYDRGPKPKEILEKLAGGDFGKTTPK